MLSLPWTHPGRLLAAVAAVYAIPSLAIEPPARFSGQPAMAAKVIRSDIVPTFCRNASQKKGCAYPGTQLCVIVIARGLSSSAFRAVLRHEKAHCNGWPADHRR
jgi:hypothetical protein